MNETPFQNPRGGYFTMNDRGRLVAEKQHNPNNVHMGERYYGRQGPMGNPRLAGFDPGNRRPIYDRNGKLVPQRPVLGNKWNLPRDIPVPSMDYVGSRTASNDYGYGTDNFYNPNDDEYYDDYSDMYKDNPMRDDFYVQDPFSDIWGNQGGPLSFS